MIDGLYPSQLVQIETMKSSHYRNLKQIINKSTQHISHPSINFLHISRNKKQNHQNWKTFNSLRAEENRFRKNISLYDKLQIISSKRSRYAMRTEVSPPRDPLLHHNYLYQCHRRYQKIDHNNQIIASKILKVKGNIDRKKQEEEFKVNKFNVSRLEKFQRIKRLNRIVSKSMSQKFNVSSRITSRTPVIRINAPNPQSP